MMESAFSIVVGMLFAFSVYLMLSGSLIRLVLGIFVLGNATHLLIFVAGRLTREQPPLIPAAMEFAEPGFAKSSAPGADPDGYRYQLLVVRISARPRLSRVSDAGHGRYGRDAGRRTRAGAGAIARPRCLSR